MNHRPVWILPVIVLTQFAGGALWFSGNAVLPELLNAWSLGNHAIGYVTSAVQLGFICGTLIFTSFAIADRFSPRKLFFVCCLAGAAANSLILILPESFTLLLLLRFITGTCLAGIYPVGMKIASGWYREGLERALGYLVGALVLGTAFPHLLAASGYIPDWEAVLLCTSLTAAAGGGVMFLCVPDGPNISTSQGFSVKVIFKLLGSRELKGAAYGYFGHMWELYTFWAFLPLFLAGYGSRHTSFQLDIPLWTFAIIAGGLFGCVIGGVVSERIGSFRVAFSQLAVSGLCCLVSPLLFLLPPTPFFFVLVVWGIAAAGDSPQYSALVARSANRELVGSTLTLVNCIGFLITVMSIQLMDMFSAWISVDKLLLLLVPGPALGLYYMRFLLRD